MITLGKYKYSFPETQDEMDAWKPTIIYTALHRRVLLVAKTRIEGKWSCYCTPVPGINHQDEMHNWRDNGNKVLEHIARAVFPQFEEIPYNY